MRIVVLMHIVVLIIVVPFQTKTDVTTSSSEGFSLYVIKDAHRSVDHCSTASNETDVTTSSYEGFNFYVLKDAHLCVDHCSTVSNDLPPNRFLEFDKILKI